MGLGYCDNGAEIKKDVYYKQICKMLKELDQTKLIDKLDRNIYEMNL